MNLMDIAPIEEFDMDGNRIADSHIWVNRLCPVVKENKNGQSFICSLAYQNLSSQARQTGKPVIDECDAGFVNVFVPIFIANEFVGIAGGCGLMAQDGEVDTFLISRTTGIDETELEPLSEDVNIITDEQLKSLVTYITEQIVLLKLKNTVNV